MPACAAWWLQIAVHVQQLGCRLLCMCSNLGAGYTCSHAGRQVHGPDASAAIWLQIAPFSVCLMQLQAARPSQTAPSKVLATRLVLKAYCTSM